VSLIWLYLSTSAFFVSIQPNSGADAKWLFLRAEGPFQKSPMREPWVNGHTKKKLLG